MSAPNVDTLFAFAEKLPMCAVQFRTQNSNEVLEEAPETLERLGSFSRMPRDAGIVGHIFPGFDGLRADDHLKSVENLLAIAADCDTYFTDVLGWSGTPEDQHRFESLTPRLASELKRTAYALPS